MPSEYKHRFLKALPVAKKLEKKNEHRFPRISLTRLMKPLLQASLYQRTHKELSSYNNPVKHIRPP